MKYSNISFFLLSATLFISCNLRSSNSSSESGSDLFEEEVEWKDCIKCFGKGYNTYECTSCDGSGRITLTNSRIETRTCPTCLGTGKSPCIKCQNNGSFDCSHCMGGNVRCTECLGAGQRMLRYGDDVTYVRCGYCQGNGYIPCLYCHGESRIICDNCYGKGYRDCPTCHGTGGPDKMYSETTDAGECPSCGGTGTIKETCENCNG